MDSIDSSRPNLPAQFSAPLSLQPLSAPPLSGELARSSMPQINSQVLVRGLTRHWWLILLLWLLVWFLRDGQNTIELREQVFVEVGVEQQQRLARHTERQLHPREHDNLPGFRDGNATIV